MFTRFIKFWTNYEHVKLRNDYLHLHAKNLSRRIRDQRSALRDLAHDKRELTEVVNAQSDHVKLLLAQAADQRVAIAELEDKLRLIEMAKADLAARRAARREGKKRPALFSVQKEA